MKSHAVLQDRNESLVLKPANSPTLLAAIRQKPTANITRQSLYDAACVPDTLRGPCFKRYDMGPDKVAGRSPATLGAVFF